MWVVLVCGGLSYLIPGIARGASARLFFAGRLDQSVRQQVGEANGVISVRVRMFANQQPVEQEQPLWGPEEHAIAVADDGGFVVMLGDQVAGLGDLADREAWLDVELVTPDGGRRLEPRQQLIQGAFARTAGGVVPGTLTFRDVLNGVNSVRGEGGFTGENVRDGSIGSTQIKDGAVSPDVIDMDDFIPSVRVEHYCGTGTCAVGATADLRGAGLTAPLQFNVERWDIGAMHCQAGESSECDTSRLTVRISGVYVIHANLGWWPNFALGSRGVQIWRNGRELLAAQVGPDKAAASATVAYCLSAGDFVQIQAVDSAQPSSTPLSSGQEEEIDDAQELDATLLGRADCPVGS